MNFYIDLIFVAYLFQGTNPNNQLMGMNTGEMPGGPVGMVRQPPPQNTATNSKPF